ncbi:hypothetical protein GET28_24100, partial [Shigella flexneri]|nr:hypothetical protein [Shigella flexneri]
FCSLLAPSDAILFQEGVSVKLRLPQTDTPEPTRPVTNPFWRKNHGSLAAANRGVAEYELSE